jgi:hypothetical protein
MSSIRISLAEKPLLDHLQRGGDVFDPVGRELVAKCAGVAYKDSEVAAIAQRHDISLNDIAIIYASMIKSLIPNPCIKSGGLLLVPTLFFMEPIRFEGLASEIATRTRGSATDEKQQTLINLSIASARETWQTHTAGRGEAAFTITASGGRKTAGCAGMVVVSLLLGGGVAGGILYFLV